MSQYPLSIDLADLSGAIGFQMISSPGDRAGYSISSIGDFNGDGKGDLLIGAKDIDPAGGAYVVYGGSTFPDTLHLSEMSSSFGFKLTGELAGDGAGWIVNALGDVNGDGLADVAIGGLRYVPGGAPFAFHHVYYVVFGRQDDQTSSLSWANLSGADGFEITGAIANNSMARSISSAGDLNGDGFSDILFGANKLDGTNLGGAYVLFGHSGAFPSSIDISDIDGHNGFKIVAASNNFVTGWNVSSIGDVNNDGTSDVIITSFESGNAFVLFGNKRGFAEGVSLNNLNGNNGFKIVGGPNYSYNAASSAAGDVNGDGISDLMLGYDQAGDKGRYTGAAFIIYGTATGFERQISLSNLDGSNGFKIIGSTGHDFLGQDLAAAGDVNGDGYDDVILGAQNSGPPGSYSPGAAFVVFGAPSGGPPAIDLANLTPALGFALRGSSNFLNAGHSVSSAGDLNMDGLADLAIGAQTRSLVYVAYSRLPTESVHRIGSEAAQTLVGGNLDDTLSGLSGDDQLWGHGGNDVLDGGDGTDTAHFSGLRSAFLISESSGVVTVTGADGVDTLTGVEWLKFDDQVVETGGPPGNHPPVISGAATGGVAEDGAGTATGQLTASDLDPGAAFAWSIQGSATSAYGTFAVDATGQWAYTLDPALADPLTSADHPTETFTVRVDDGQGGSDLQTVVITVEGADEASPDQTFTATPGPDVFDGGDGVDTVTYAGAAAGVRVDLRLADPQNTHGSDRDQLTGIENLVGSAFDDKLTGDAAANRLEGGAGADSLKGGDGDDVVLGGEGDDVLSGNGGVDTVSYAGAGAGVTVALGLKVAQDTGGAGIDLVTGFETLVGSGFADTLLGDKKANALTGGAGDDLLTGAAGADLLTGGLGADHFIYVALTDSTVRAGGQDVITDFSHADGDLIDLSALDADTGDGADTAFHLVAGGFTHHAGELMQTAQAGGYLIRGDVNGDGATDFAILVQTTAALTAADFVL